MTVRGKRAKMVFERHNPPTPHLDTPREFRLPDNKSLALRKIDSRTAHLIVDDEDFYDDPDTIVLSVEGLRWLRGEIDMMLARMK